MYFFRKTLGLFDFVFVLKHFSRKIMKYCGSKNMVSGLSFVCSNGIHSTYIMTVLDCKKHSIPISCIMSYTYFQMLYYLYKNVYICIKLRLYLNFNRLVLSLWNAILDFIWHLVKFIFKLDEREIIKKYKKLRTWCFSNKKTLYCLQKVVNIFLNLYHYLKKTF